MAENRHHSRVINDNTHLLLNPEKESFMVLLNSFVRQKIDLNFNTLIYGQFSYQKMKLIKGKIPRPGFCPKSGQAGDIGEFTYHFGFDGLSFWVCQMMKYIKIRQNVNCAMGRFFSKYNIKKIM